MPRLVSMEDQSSSFTMSTRARHEPGRHRAMQSNLKKTNHLKKRLTMLEALDMAGSTSNNQDTFTPSAQRKVKIELVVEAPTAYLGKGSKH